MGGLSLSRGLDGAGVFSEAVREVCLDLWGKVCCKARSLGKLTPASDPQI